MRLLLEAVIKVFMHFVFQSFGLLLGRAPVFQRSRSQSSLALELLRGYFLLNRRNLVFQQDNLSHIHGRLRLLRLQGVVV